MHRRRLLFSLLALPATRAFSAVQVTRLSVITDEAASTPQEAIAFAHKFGLKCVELRGVPGRRNVHYSSLSEPELKEAGRQFKENGLRVSFFNSGLLKTTLPGTEPLEAARWNETQRAARMARHQEAFENRIADLRKNIRAAQLLGADLLRVFAFLRTSDPGANFARIADILGEMTAIAAKEGVRLCVENETSCNVATSGELAQLTAMIPERAFGINWDPMNGRRFGDNPFPDGYRKLPLDRVFNVQIKGKTVAFPEERLDWKAIFTTMDADGYKGCFGLETHIFDERLIEHSHECMEAIVRIVREIS